MNDIVLFVFSAVASTLIGLAWFHVYRGIRGSLVTAKVGEVYNFRYLQPVTDVPERFMAKVVGIQTLDEKQIERLNRRSNYRRHDMEFKRSRHLITAQTFDGKIRNFYAERTADVRKPLLGGMVFKIGLASLLF